MLNKIMPTRWHLNQEVFSVAKVFETIEHFDWFTKMHNLEQLLKFSLAEIIYVKSRGK